MTINIETELWRILDNVNKWLEFAEKKNAIILTFLGIQITASKFFIDYLDNSDSLHSPCLTVSFTLLFLGFITLLISFFPKTVISDCLYKLTNFSALNKSISPNGNVIFYGDIAKHTQWTYITELETHLGTTIKGNKYLEDLSNQIVQNSAITSRKFFVCKIASYFIIVGQLILFLSIWL